MTDGIGGECDHISEGVIAGSGPYASHYIGLARREGRAGMTLTIMANLEPVAQPRLRHSTRLIYVGQCAQCGGTRMNQFGKRCSGCDGLGVRVKKIPTKSLPDARRAGKKIPHPVIAYRKELVLIAQEARTRWPTLFPIVAPVEFWCRATHARPATITRARREAEPWIDMEGPYRRTSAPDWDNLGKAITDAFEGEMVPVPGDGEVLIGALVADDRYIWRGTVETWTAAPGRPPRVEVRLSWDPAESTPAS